MEGGEAGRARGEILPGRRETNRASRYESVGSCRAWEKMVRMATKTSEMADQDLGARPPDTRTGAGQAGVVGTGGGGGGGAWEGGRSGAESRIFGGALELDRVDEGEGVRVIPVRLRTNKPRKRGNHPCRQDTTPPALSHGARGAEGGPSLSPRVRPRVRGAVRRARSACSFSAWSCCLGRYSATHASRAVSSSSRRAAAAAAHQDGSGPPPGGGGGGPRSCRGGGGEGRQR